jgi:chemotaxis protein methyltransferase CheR
MADAESVTFLQWALPRLHRRWRGYKNVRGQVEKRIRRRIAALGLSGFSEYRTRLEADPDEWNALDSLCGVTISRFHRDRRVWETLRDDVIPTLAGDALAAGEHRLRCWSLGCASGEEPYTLSILWTLALAERHPRLSLEVIATDVDEEVLDRARVGIYESGSLRELPESTLDEAFERHEEAYRLRERFRAPVEFRKADVRDALPGGAFRLLLCRNLVFTYFDEELQRETLDRLLTSLVPGGAFVVAPHEQLPAGAPLEPWFPRLGIYRRPGPDSAHPR